MTLLKRAGGEATVSTLAWAADHPDKIPEARAKDLLAWLIEKAGGKAVQEDRQGYRVLPDRAPEIGARYRKSRVWSDELKRSHHVAYKLGRNYFDIVGVVEFDLPIDDVGVWEYSEDGWTQHGYGVPSVHHGHQPRVAGEPMPNPAPTRGSGGGR